MIKNQRIYTITSERLPKEFDDFTITHISDLHTEKLDEYDFEMIDGDIVVITGDWIDGKQPDMSCIGTLNKITERCPVYYVTGNHEAASMTEMYVLEQLLPQVNVLHNRSCILKRNSAKIKLIGLDDMTYMEYRYGCNPCEPDDRLADFHMKDYSIVLLHDPKNIEHISKYDPDLVLSGHTHGGQFRLPKIGALYAPGQGFFPKYDSGHFKVNNTDLIISNGIGCSRINKRINCPAEINKIVLKSKTDN